MEYEEMKRLFPNRNVAEQSRTGPNVRDSPFNPAAAGTGSARTTGTEALLPSTNPSMSTEIPKPYGPLVLHDPQGAEADIVLIHGLGGHRESTWTKPGPVPCFWPRDLLSADLPQARIITWGYDAKTAKLFDVVSVANLTSHAVKLCTELAHLRHEVKERPIFFVTHSMGGIVIKKVVLHSNESNMTDISPITGDTRGIIFMGTPHAGSEHADLGSLVVKIVKISFQQVNSSMLNELRLHSPDRQDLEQRFNALLLRRRQTKTAIEVRCFCETEPMSAVSGLVLPSFSAAPAPYESPINVDANHVNMTKFTGRDDQTYQNVLSELKRMMKLAKERQEQTDVQAENRHATHIGNNTHGALANYANQNTSSQSGGSVHYGNVNTF